MRTAIALVLVFLVGAPVPGEPGVMDGNKLKEGLDNFEKMSRHTATNEEVFAHLGAQGYVAGVADSYEVLGVVCVPSKVTLGQLQDVVLKYLDAHPEGRHNIAASLVLKALTEAFPCGKAKAP
jgi:Rap1a immunity proteins